MKIILLLLNFTLSHLLTDVQDYNKDTQQALETWYAGKSEIAAQQFQKIAEAHPDKWLPNYYVGLVNATRAFAIKDEKRFEETITTAQAAVEKELEKDANNAELLVVQVLIYTAYLAKDPMAYGPVYYPKVNMIYAKASKIAPENPRVFLEKASFTLKSAQYVGGNSQDACEDLKKAKDLFATFQNNEAFYPHWGEEQLDEVVKQCN